MARSDQHNEDNCTGSFVRVFGSDGMPGETAADALVCTECGSHKPMEAMNA
jgi:hypothetical protein